MASYSCQQPLRCVSIRCSARRTAEHSYVTRNHARRGWFLFAVARDVQRNPTPSGRPLTSVNDVRLHTRPHEARTCVHSGRGERRLCWSAAYTPDGPIAPLRHPGPICLIHPVHSHASMFQLFGLCHHHHAGRTHTLADHCTNQYSVRSGACACPTHPTASQHGAHCRKK